jgi:2-amino-4-hydroxy-6-hydroxymethyldihydropteridine diphosphokinase
MKTKHKTYIAIGSNLDDPIKQVKSGIKQLSKLPKSHLISVSQLYQSPPIESDDQPDYINAVVKLETSLAAHDLLTELERIEFAHGRTRNTRRWGPRTLDLDLILFDDLSINTSRLIVPHPEFHKRAFVLVPLYEIEPELTLPSGKKLQELIDELSEKNLSIIDAQEGSC